MKLRTKSLTPNAFRVHSRSKQWHQTILEKSQPGSYFQYHSIVIHRDIAMAPQVWNYQSSQIGLGTALLSCAHLFWTSPVVLYVCFRFTAGVSECPSERQNTEALAYIPFSSLGYWANGTLPHLQQEKNCSLRQGSQTVFPWSETETWFSNSRALRHCWEPRRVENRPKAWDEPVLDVA